MKNQQNQDKSRKPRNFEGFDLWAKSQFTPWSQARYDFELICELTRHIPQASKCLPLLHTVNSYINTDDKHIFFDGTIKSLKYLIKNDYLSLDKLPNDTDDQKLLLRLLRKYSEKLDVMDIVASIEEPTFRSIATDYPHLFEYLVKENPHFAQEVAKALVVNGVAEDDDFTRLTTSESDVVEVDIDKNSVEAMKCKHIYLGLHVNENRFSVSRNCSVLIDELSSLTDQRIEEGDYTKGVFNAMYVSFYGQNEWSKENHPSLSGCDYIFKYFQLLFLPDNLMSFIYDEFLSGIVDETGEKYFGDMYHPKGFVASLAIKMVIVIILMRSDSKMPKDEPADTPYFGGPPMSGLNYALYETKKSERPLEMKPWFKDYFTEELDKRMAFLKLQLENDVAVFEMMGRERIQYLPVFESFRFFCNRFQFLPEIIRLFKNQKVSSEVKNEIYINFALNTQKIIADHNTDEHDNEIKDIFILLIRDAFKGLLVNVVNSARSSAKKFYETNDLDSDATLAIIQAVLEYDVEKNDNFIAYLKSTLLNRLRSLSRGNKTDQTTYTGDNFEEDFWEHIPSPEDFLSKLEDKSALEQIKGLFDSLSEKEREAVKKQFEQNEKLSDTERRAKNRGLDKIRKLMSEN